ncbi:MAG: hypothetical protein WC608_01705 [Parcubacteria group bacterium]
MGVKINIPVGTRVSVEYNDIEDRGTIIGKITNIFNGLVIPNLDYNQEAVAGIFVEKWIENGRNLEIQKNINDKTNIFRPDIIREID